MFSTQVAKAALFTSINMKPAPGSSGIFEFLKPDLKEWDPELYESFSAR
jgi:hypothetical protein